MLIPFFKSTLDKSDPEKLEDFKPKSSPEVNFPPVIDANSSGPTWIVSPSWDPELESGFRESANRLFPPRETYDG